MKKCSNCGYENADDQKWCARCMMKLPEYNAATGDKGNPFASGFAPYGYCAFCGSPRQNGNSFCTQCGKPYPGKTKRKQPFPSGKTVIRLVAIVCVIALLAGLIGQLLMGREGNWTVKKAKDAISMLKENSSQFGFDNALSELSLKNESTVAGDTYYRLQQNYKGIPVYNRSVICGIDAQGNTTSVTGNPLDVDEAVDTTPSVSLETVNLALKEYAQNELAVPAQYLSVFQAQQLHKDDLCIYLTDQTALAYRFCLGNYEFLADAHTGRILLAESTVLAANRVYGDLQGQERTYPTAEYSKEDDVNYLSDLTRNITGNTVTEKLTYDWWGYGFILTKDSTAQVSWNNQDQPDKAAVDGYVNTQITYDFFQQKLNILSADGEGQVRFTVNTGLGYEESDTTQGEYERYWNNAYSTPDFNTNTVNLFFGVGTGKNFDMSHYLDVVAHEYMHGVERFHSAMRYSGESGAIMEGLSDIFGELVEGWHNQKDPDWLHGTSRNIQTPSNSNNPNFYNGTNWVNPSDLTNDKGGVHNNSTVISHAAYLMWKGLPGSDKLTADELAELWYRAMLMMPPECSFSQCRKLVELAADSMETLSGGKKLCIQKAFDKVGIFAADASASPDYRLTQSATLQVLDKSKEPLGGYTLEIIGQPALHEIAAAFYSDIGYRYTAQTTVSSEDPYQLNLPDGTYQFRITSPYFDREYLLCVEVNDQGTEDQLVLVTQYQPVLVVPVQDDLQSILLSTDWVDISPQWNFIIRFHEGGTYTEYPVDPQTDTILLTPSSTGTYTVTDNAVTLDGQVRLEFTTTSEDHPDWPGWEEEKQHWNNIGYTGNMLFDIPEQYDSMIQYMRLIPTEKKAEQPGELCGQWNLYQGGQINERGERYNVDFRTVILREDGTAMIGQGYAASEYIWICNGTWSCWGKNAQGDYPIHLTLTDGDIEFGEDYWIQPTASLSGNQITFQILEDPYDLIAYGQAYEKDLSFVDWMDSLSAGSGWKGAYRDWIMQNGDPNYGQYGLFYTDGDEIPELYAYNGGSDIKICTYADGAVSFIGADNLDTLTLYENGCLRTSGERKGCIIESFYALQNGAFSTLGTGIYYSTQSPYYSNQITAANLYSTMAKEYVFTSGAGAWATSLTLHPDGSFEGSYHDSEMGITGDGYPNGTVYTCNFSGKFSAPVKTDDYTYYANLESLTTEGQEGSIYYENGIRYIVSNPYGMDNPGTFWFYLPGALVSDLPEEFLSWAHLGGNPPYVLPPEFYGIYNEGGQTGFVSHQDAPGESQGIYQWDGQTVSEQEFYAKINNLCGSGPATLIPEQRYSYNEILNQLQ